MNEQFYSLWQRLRRRIRENKAARIWVYHDNPAEELARHDLTKQDAKKGLKRIHVPLGLGVTPFGPKPRRPC